MIEVMIDGQHYHGGYALTGYAPTSTRISLVIMKKSKQEKIR